MTLIPALERELTSAAHRAYRPKRQLLPSRPAIGAALAALTAAITTAVLALSSGTSAAFAGWTNIPGPPTAKALATAREVCGNVPPADVVAAEARGPFTAIVYLRGGSPWQCVTKDTKLLMHQSTPFPPNVVVKPAPGRVSVPIVTHTVVGAAPNRSLNGFYERDDALFGSPSYTQDEKIAAGSKARALRTAETAIILGPNSLSAVSGSIGAGVSGVTIVLRNGTRVKATVGRGWYLAWWPGTSRPSENIPTSIRVTTAAGTTTAPYAGSYLAKVYGPCLAFEGCPGGPWTIRVIRGVSPSLIEHFSLFRDTAPITLKDATSGIPPLLANSSSLGLDDSQIRKVPFGSRGAIWVVPGTEGACAIHGSATDMNAPNTGGGGCTNLSAALHKGVITGGSQTFGLVADGNPTVTICMTSGHRVTVPVKDNVFFLNSPDRPGTIYFKNAYGKPAHQLEWFSKQCTAETMSR